MTTYTYCDNQNPNRCCKVTSGLGYHSAGFYIIPSKWNIGVRGHVFGHCKDTREFGNSNGRQGMCLVDSKFPLLYANSKISSVGYSSVGSKEVEYGSKICWPDGLVLVDRTNFIFSAMRDDIVNELVYIFFMASCGWYFLDCALQQCHGDYGISGTVPSAQGLMLLSYFNIKRFIYYKPRNVKNIEKCVNRFFTDFLTWIIGAIGWNRVITLRYHT